MMALCVGWRRCFPDIPSSPVFLWFMVLCDLDFCWTRTLVYNQLLDIKGFVWKDSQAGQLPKNFLPSERGEVSLAVTQVSELQLTEFSALLIRHSAELDLQQHGNRPAQFWKSFDKEVWMKPGCSRSWFPFTPCPALFLPRAWCWNTFQEWCSRVRKMLGSDL